jgi:hypothetical protein
MNFARFIVVTVVLLSLCRGALASSPAEEKRACVAASTEGQIARDEGRLLDAREQLLLCAQDHCPAVVRKSCGEWLADIEERIPSVVVRALDASGQDLTDVTLTIDGKEVPLDGRPVMLDPGPHELQVTEASGVTEERKVLLAEKEKARLVNVNISINVHESQNPEGSLASQDAPAPAPSEKREYHVPAGAWVLGGVGVLGLGTFAVMGAMAKSDLDDLEKTCSPNCSQSDADAGKTKALIADISLGVGAAALVGALTWALVAKKRSKEAPSISLLPTRTGGMATLSGRF